MALGVLKALRPQPGRQLRVVCFPCQSLLGKRLIVPQGLMVEQQLVEGSEMLGERLWHVLHYSVLQIYSHQIRLYSCINTILFVQIRGLHKQGHTCLSHAPQEVPATLNNGLCHRGSVESRLKMPFALCKLRFSPAFTRP